MSSLVFAHASDDAVGEDAFVGPACFESDLALGGLASEEGAGVIEASLLGDADDVEDAVDPSVAAEVDAVADGIAVASSRRQRRCPTSGRTWIR